jgi:hypothetical protein
MKNALWAIAAVACAVIGYPGHATGQITHGNAPELTAVQVGEGWKIIGGLCAPLASYGAAEAE